MRFLLNDADLAFGTTEIDRRVFERPVPTAHAAEFRHGSEQLFRISVVWLLEDLPDGRLLDLSSPPHHDHPIRDLGDHPHIMSDEHHRHADLVLKGGDQLQNLRLDGDIEGGGRLVGDEELRPAGEGHRDHHPLTHAAGEEMRVIVNRRAASGMRTSSRISRAVRSASSRDICR